MSKNLDVKEIMKDISFKAREREISVDLEMLESLDLTSFNTDSFSTQVNDSVLLSELRDLKSHRKGFFGKVLDKILKKILGAVRIFISPVLRKQEFFNREQNDFKKSQIFLNKDNTKFKEITNSSILDMREDLNSLGGFQFLDIDYLKFEENFGGVSKDLDLKYSKYLKFFRGKNKVLDVGCGRGDFLSLLSSVDASGIGVEMDENMVSISEKRGYEVVKNDVLSYFKSLIDLGDKDLFDGLVARQVVEHFNVYYLNDFLKLSYRLLRNDSFIVLETVNIKSLSVFTNNLYLDPSHKMPVHPQMLKFLLENAGFKDVEFIFSGEFDESTKLEKIDANAESEYLYNRNIDKLNELLFAPQDYAAVAKKV